MAVEYVILKISEEVTAGTEVADTYAPPDNAKQIILQQFIGDAPYTQNSAVRVVWDFNDEGEEQIWSTKGSEQIQSLDEFITGADGVKEIALCCGNGESGDIFMSAKLVVRVVT